MLKNRVMAVVALVLVWNTPAAGQDVVVTPDWLAANLDDVVVVNVQFRSGTYAQEHIPGSRELMWNSFVSNDAPGAEMLPVERMADAFEAVGVGSDTRVVFYSENPIPASRAFMVMDYLGHDMAHVLDGGLAAWKMAGHATASGASPDVEPGDLRVNLRSDMLVDADWVMANLENDAVRLIDARPDNEYTGDGIDESDTMKKGHIPGARQIYYTDLVRSEDDRRFLELDDLVARFREADARDGQTLVSYCMVGMRASVTYMISRHLGYDAKFYDGSWHDWSMKDLPRVEGTEPGGR